MSVPEYCACTSHWPFELKTSLPVSLATYPARCRSGTMMSRRTASDRATAQALADVQQISASALTSAVVFTYATMGKPGYDRRITRTYSASSDSASEQRAFILGSRTRFLGHSNFTVSAMKWTPQTTIVRAEHWAA